LGPGYCYLVDIELWTTGYISLPPLPAAEIAFSSLEGPQIAGKKLK
jgi:hypothetical protein